MAFYGPIVQVGVSQERVVIAVKLSGARSHDPSLDGLTGFFMGCGVK